MTKGRVLLLLFLCGLNAGCPGPPAILLQGDANSAEISYRGDLESAAAVAKRHCAQYERVPQLLGTAIGTAYYNCVTP